MINILKKIHFLLLEGLMFIKSKWKMFKYRWKRNDWKKYKHSYKSQEFFKYCLKILENPQYKYTTYKEQLFYNELLNTLKEVENPDITIDYIAYQYIQVIIGLLGKDAFDLDQYNNY